MTDQPYRTLLGTFLLAALLAVAPTPAFAQATTDPNQPMQTDDIDDDDGMDWGWIGLLGLAGLYGLKGRDRDRHVDTTTTRRV